MSALAGLFDSELTAFWVLAWVRQALLYGTLLAGLTWLLTRLLRKRIPAGLSMALWSIVLVRFLIPFGPSWSHSLPSLCESIYATTPAPTPSSDFAGWQPIETLPAMPTTVVERPYVAGPTPRPLPWTVLLVGLYLLAVTGLFALRFRSYRAFQVHCRALPLANDPTRRLVTAVCQRLGIRRIPATHISDKPPAPFVTGVIHPILVLTRRQLVRPDELETVIVHEVAHLRRGDILVQLLQRIAGTILFFWPIVAWVNRRIDTAREYACDEWALRHGRLSAGQYARCLLRATQPLRAAPLAYRPACMANHTSNIERRIDVILESLNRPTTRRTWGLPTLALLLLWSGFALAGADDAAKGKSWPATEEAVKEHAIELYNLTAEHKAADFNGDGQLSYLEKDVYLVALAMQNADAFMEEFPYADRNHSEHLDYLEVYGAIRGITLIAYADRRPTADPDVRLDLEFYHLALDAQQWLLANSTREPKRKDLDNIWSVLARVQNPRNDHMRKLNHGRPVTGEPAAMKVPAHDRPRFQELEANIAVLEAKLATTKNAQEIERLNAMLAKLETLLARLNEE